MKSIKRFVFGLCALIIILVIIKIISPIINKKIEKTKLENSIMEFLNDGIIENNIVSDGIEWIEYAKNDNVNNYDITDFVENYYSLIEESIKAKIYDLEENSYSRKGFDYVTYNRVVDIYKGLTIHGLNKEEAKFVISNITIEDIDDYKNNVLRDKLNNELKKVFTFNNEKWYINSNTDKHIELPYNVYLDYISNKKENLSAKKILKVKIMNKDLDDISISEILPIECKFKYINNNNNQVNEEIIHLKFADKTNKVLSLTNLGGLYYQNQNRAELTVGQHDYDEAKRKEEEELNEFFAELSKSGKEITPKMSSDDYDKYENYKSKESAIDKE